MLRLRISNIAIFSLIVWCGIAFHAHAITISPVRVELRGNPGTTVGGDVTITNDQQETKTYYVSYENFEAQGDTGVPKFVGASDGLATWLHTSSEVTIAAGESKTIPYTVTIPTSATPGGYFSAIFWSTTPPSAQGAGRVSIGAKIGMLVLLSVNGDIAESAGLQGFALTNNDHFHTALPVSFEYGFVNTGGDRVQPSGDIVIRNIFGWVAKKIPANPVEGNVLPRTKRTFHTAWNTDNVTSYEKGFLNQVRYEWNHFAFGIYRAKPHLIYGAQQQQVTARAVLFVVFPWHLVVAILIPITLLWVILRRVIRSYTERIIRQTKERLSQ